MDGKGYFFVEPDYQVCESQKIFWFKNIPNSLANNSFTSFIYGNWLSETKSPVWNFFRVEMERSEDVHFELLGCNVRFSVLIQRKVLIWFCPSQALSFSQLIDNIQSSRKMADNISWNSTILHFLLKKLGTKRCLKRDRRLMWKPNNPTHIFNVENVIMFLLPCIDLWGIFAQFIKVPLTINVELDRWFSANNLPHKITRKFFTLIVTTKNV